MENITQITTGGAGRPTLLTTEEAAAYLGISPFTLAHWRSEGLPHPRAVQMGRRALRYRPADLEAFIEQQLEEQSA